METAGPFARPHDLAILCYIEHRGLEGGTLLANAVNHEIARRSRLGKVSSLGILIGLILFSFPANAQNYPISGVWVAIDPNFPTSIKESCIALKKFGVEAVLKKSIAELVIFAKDKRVDVKGDVHTETNIKSIKVVDGGYRITEVFNKRATWFRFKRKTTFVLNVIDPQTIEIRDATGTTRYAKCRAERPPI
jgi:hypothetical protein